MVTKFLFAAVVGGLVSNAAELPRQFDFVCTSREVESGREYGSRLKVDLDKMKWCIDSCTGIVPIVRVTEDKVIFADDDDESGSQHIWVNFKTGEYRHDTDIKGLLTTVPTVGSCRIGDFTGLTPS